jgi:hypothetical protein
MTKGGTTKIRHAEGQAQGTGSLEGIRCLGVLRAEWRLRGAQLRLKAAAAQCDLVEWERDDALLQAQTGTSAPDGGGGGPNLSRGMGVRLHQ